MLFSCEVSLRSLRVFRCWWSFTGVWFTVSLLGSPELFSVLLSLLTMLWSRWSRGFLLFPVPPVFFPRLCEWFQEHQLQLISSSPLYSSFIGGFFVCLFVFALFFACLFFLVLWQRLNICYYFTSCEWSLSDSKSLQFSRTLISILNDLNNAVAISNSSNSLGNHFKHASYIWYHRHPHVPKLS